MSTEIIILLTALISFLGTLLGGFVLVWREVRGVQDGVQSTHMLINSRMDELLELTREQAHAKGVSDEKARSDRKR